jgi:hypothetical protein
MPETPDDYDVLAAIKAQIAMAARKKHIHKRASRVSGYAPNTVR